MRPHFSIGCYDCRGTTQLRQGIHFSRIQVLFADHMHRLAGVDNKFSFLRFKIWCRQAPVFRRWEECCFVLLLLILTHFWPASTLLRGHLALAIPSILETAPQILERWCYRWWGSPGQINPREGFWSRMSAWRAIHFVNFTRWIGFCMSELFRKIDDNFGGSMSWNTQPKLSCIWWVVYNGSHRSIMLLMLLQHCHCTFVTFLFGPFARLFINLATRIRALFSKFAPTLGLVEQAFWRVTFHRMNWCKFPWGNPCRAVETFFHWYCFLWDFGFSTHFSLCNSETDSAVSILHAYEYRDGNYNCLLQNSAR